MTAWFYTFLTIINNHFTYGMPLVANDDPTNGHCKINGKSYSDSNKNSCPARGSCFYCIDKSNLFNHFSSYNTHFLNNTLHL
jgi:hypothetical protein